MKRITSFFALLIISVFSIQAQAVLVSQFNFNGSLTDTLSNGTLTEYNNQNTFYSNGTFSWESAGTMMGGGFTYSVPDALLDENYFSVSIRFKLSNTSGYRKFLDFNNLNSDQGVYINGSLRLYSIGSFGAFTILPDSFINVLFTRNVDDTCKLYLQQTGNLTLESFGYDNSSFFSPVLDGTQRKIHFFHDDSTTISEYSDLGSVDEIKIWNGTPVLNEVIAVQNEEGLIYKIFPNPASANTTIQFAKPYTGMIYLVDVTGKIVLNLNVDHSSVVNFNLGTLPQGIYFIKGDGVFEKIIKSDQ